MQSTTTHEAERAAISARYKAELRRGVVPSVYIPRPLNITTNSNNPSTTTKKANLCSACRKPSDRESLPGHFILVSMNCFHSFCSQCCLRMAGRTTCMRRGCNESIPAATQEALATQKRSWTVKQALAYCQDDEHIPLSWHNGLKGVKPSYDKAVDFLQDTKSPSSLTANSDSAYIDIDSLRPQLVGFANLLVSMRDAEAHLNDLDADPTDLLRQRKLRYTVMSVDHYLVNQAKQRKRCTTSMLREYLQPGANQVLDKIWGLINNFPAWIISAADDEDVKLLFDFVIELCKDEAEKRSLMSKSTAIISRVKSQMQWTAE